MKHKCIDYYNYCKKWSLEHGYTMRFCERFNDISPLGMECIEVDREKEDSFSRIGGQYFFK